MYTLQPLPVIDTFNTHTGFWLLLTIVGFVYVITAAWANECNKPKALIVLTVVCSALLIYAGIESWTTGKITMPVNERVTGKLKTFTAEGEAYNERQGKQTIKRENHYLYVVYTIEGNDVIFTAQSGKPYPQYAIFYKN